MKMIQTLYDLEGLKRTQVIPIEMLKQIEQDFLHVYDSVNDNVYLMDFRLPFHQALLLLEQGDEVQGMLGDPLEIEYIEKESMEGQDYYRKGKREDHDIQINYSLVGIHDKDSEQFLKEYLLWSEGGRGTYI